MTEDELLAGITDALTLAGWRWTHIRRSDRITQGFEGLPDIIAVHPERAIVLAWELKTDLGVISTDQWGWLVALRDVAGVDARVVRPSDYDAALLTVFGQDPVAVFA